MKEVIKDFYGRIIGYKDTLANGDIRVTGFDGSILGFYRKSQDRTVDFYGRLVAKGNQVGMLLSSQIRNK